MSSKNAPAGWPSDTSINARPSRGVVFVELALFAAAAALLLAASAASAGGWQGPGLLEGDTTNIAIDPQVAADDAGNAIVVWTGAYGGQASVLANRYDVSLTSWGVPFPIESNDTVSTQGPHVAMDRNGNAIVVWAQWDGAVYSLWANEFAPEAGWKGAELIEFNDSGSVMNQTVTFGPGGTALVLWSQSDGARNNIWGELYLPGSGWAGAQLLETDDTGTAIEPQGAPDADGNAIAVWSQNDGTRYNIWANRYVAGAGWQRAVLVETDDTGDALLPQVALDTVGNAVAVWQQRDATRYNIWTNRFDVKVPGWGTAELLETNDSGDSFGQQVAADPKGNAFALWSTIDGFHIYVWERVYSPKAGWGKADRVFPYGVDCWEPHVAAFADGSGLAVIITPNLASTEVWSVQFVPGSGWQFPEVVGENSLDSAFADVAYDGGGNAFAAWRSYDMSGISSIWANRRVETTPPVLFIDSPLEGFETDQSRVPVLGRTEPGASVSVDGVAVAVEANGTFVGFANPAAGPTTITVTAEDSAQNLATVTVNVTYHPLGAGLSAPVLDQSADQNQSANFAVNVSNGGTEAISILLSGSSSLGWAVAFSNASLVLGPGEQTTVNVTVQVPLNAPPLTVDALNLTANASRPFAPNTTLLLVTRVRAQFFTPTLAASVTAQDRPGGGMALYAVSVRNAGNNRDTISLTAAAAPLGWTLAFSQGSVTLNAGDAATVNVSVGLPQSLTGALSWAALITATAGDGIATATLALNTSIALPDFAIADGDITMSNDSPAVGEQVTLQVTVRNVGHELAVEIVVRLSTGTANLSSTVTMPVTGTAYATFTWTAVAGRSELRVSVDPANNVPESNEANNGAVRVVTVNGPVSAPAEGGAPIALIALAVVAAGAAGGALFMRSRKRAAASPDPETPAKPESPPAEADRK
jgi:hypothetical protein